MFLLIRELNQFFCPQDILIHLKLMKSKRQEISGKKTQGKDICSARYKELYKIIVTKGASLVAQLVKKPPAMRETPIQFLGLEDLLEKG